MKVRSSLNTKLFWVIVRGNLEAMLAEPTILRLGSSLLWLISPSATPTSDHLNGVTASVLVFVRTYPIRASLSTVAERGCIGEREHCVDGIAGTWKTRDVARRIEAVTWKRDGLIIVCQEEVGRDLTFRPNELLNISRELIVVEMARIREN